MSGKSSARALLVGAVICLAAIGCHKKPTSPAPSQASAPQAMASPGPAAQPTPPQPVATRKTRFVISTAEATPPIAQIIINGPPADPGYAAPYQLQEVSAVQGTPPAAGPYYLLRGVGQKQAGGSLGISGDPLLGPFFLERLPDGVRLTNLVPLGSFQAKSKGYMGPGISNPNMTSLTPQQYTFFEASVEGP